MKARRVKLNMVRHKSNLLWLLCFSLLMRNTAAAQQIQPPDVPAITAKDYSQSLQRNAPMVTFIENALVQNGLPKMLRNLAMIESDFDRNCVSSAQAVGVWQVTPDAAAYYGLADSNRNDVYKSTLMAIRNLKGLYNKYHNWITVVAAYNCGEGNVNKAMQKAGSNKYQMFYTHLPAETINHVHKFMMACVVTNEFDYLTTDYKMFLLGIPSRDKDTLKNIHFPLISKTHTSLVSTEINTSFNLTVIAQEMNITIDELKSWNPGIEEKLAQTGVGSLYLPVDLMPHFLLLKNDILNRSLNINN